MKTKTVFLGSCCYSNCKNKRKSNFAKKNNASNFNTYQLIIPPTKYQSSRFIAYSKVMPMSYLPTNKTTQNPPILSTIFASSPIVAYKPTINIQSSSFKSTFQTCIQRHNVTYNMYSPPIKSNNPLAIALQNKKNIRLPLVLPILNGDFQEHDDQMT